MRVRSLILHANGTNRDHEAAQALELAGAAPDIVHLNELRGGARRWDDYQLVVIPGGFSYADALGAGKLLALDLQAYFADEVAAYVERGRPVIGICNGFQALVKAGLLPGGARGQRPAVTLTFNTSGRFECRWVSLLPQASRCVWTRGLPEAIYCPVAHGEGNFVVAEPHVIDRLRQSGQIALVYGGPQGAPAGGAYPHNPNGSAADIAGICNPSGNVFGLMPHPEDHLFDYQHPRWSRGERAGLGLPLFVNGVRYAEEL
jgi:phosphoribosylformylglycinamidine synthase